MTNEKTSKHIAKLAGFLLQALKKFDDKQFMAVNGQRVVSVGVVKKICGSTLTQREDLIDHPIIPGAKTYVGLTKAQYAKAHQLALKPKRKPARKGRK